MFRGMKEVNEGMQKIFPEESQVLSYTGNYEFVREPICKIR